MPMTSDDTCFVPWCTEARGRHSEWHQRVLLTNVLTEANGETGALQLLLYGRAAEEPRLTLIAISRDLTSRPDNIAIAPTWIQAAEMADALRTLDGQRVWDVVLARDRRSGLMSIKPLPFNGPAKLTLIEIDPSNALEMILSRTMADQLASTMFEAHHAHAEAVAR